MTIWKEYKIIGRTKHSGSPNYVKFRLNDWVEYSSGSERYIDCTDTAYFGGWVEGDTIQMDNEKTKKEGSHKTFSFYDNVAYKTTSCYYDKYWDLRREKSSSESSASTRYSNLETERNEWRRKFNDKNRDYQDEKEKREELQEKLDELKDETRRDNQANTADKLRQKETEATLRIQKAKAEEKEESAKARELGLTRLLEDTKTELSLVRVEKDNQVALFENKLDQKQQLLETVRQSLADLQVKYEKDQAQKDVEHEKEKFQKDSEVKEKEEKLRKKESEMKDLKEKLGLSQEEVLDQKIRLKGEKLDLFASDLNVELEQVQNLRDYNEEIARSRRNYDRTTIRENERKITRIKQEISQAGIQMEKIQKLCRKCEKIADLRSQLDQVLEQQYEARQEVPTK